MSPSPWQAKRACRSQQEERERFYAIIAIICLRRNNHSLLNHPLWDKEAPAFFSFSALEWESPGLKFTHNQGNPVWGTGIRGLPAPVC